MSAPCSKGLKSGGGVTVLSTTKGRPCLWAIVGDGFEVVHVALGVADGLGVEQAGVLVDRPLEVGRVARIDEAGLDAEALQRKAELRVGAAVELVAGDEVLAGRGEGRDGVEDGRLSRGEGDRARSRRGWRRGASRARRWSGSSGGCRCCRRLAGRTGRPRARYRGTRSSSSDTEALPETESPGRACGRHGGRGCRSPGVSFWCLSRAGRAAIGVVSEGRMSGHIRHSTRGTPATAGPTAEARSDNVCNLH